MGNLEMVASLVRDMTPSDPRIQLERSERTYSHGPSIRTTTVYVREGRFLSGEIKYVDGIWSKPINENLAIATLLGMTVATPFFRKRLQRAIRKAVKMVEREDLKAQRMLFGNY